MDFIHVLVSSSYDFRNKVKDHLMLFDRIYPMMPEHNTIFQKLNNENQSLGSSVSLHSIDFVKEVCQIYVMYI